MPENDDAFFAMRLRAYDLAESGDFRDWRHVSLALKDEGYQDPCIERLGGDPLAVQMITRCCNQARAQT